MYTRTLIFIAFILINGSLMAQDKCGTVAFNKKIDELLPYSDRNSQFEDWISRKIKDKKAAFRSVSITDDETTYQIPVVVHIVHQGEVEGQGSNIPEEQVLSQIETLNEDFRRLNSDASLTPSDFLGVATDVNIEFVLAKQDPEGLATDGILRVLADEISYGIDDDYELAKLSHWSADDYLNIWVTTISGINIGFAQYPLSNELGLQKTDIIQKNISITDGVYVDYSFFGTGSNAVDFSKGRTLTHEVGHWLGLRHIWGDGNCSVDDYCDDTPLQDSSTLGCFKHGESVSCGSNDMIQNYMDYTDDVCMNLFTEDQKDRMRVILENSPRRASLINSVGDEEPVSYTLDLGIVSIASPTHSECSNTLTPSILLRNYGSEKINSFDIELSKDDQVFSTTNFSASLAFLDLFEVILDEVITTDTDILNEYTLKITSVNGSELDDNTDNDCSWISTIYPKTNSIPLGLDFTGTHETQTSDWNIYNDQNTSAWQYTIANNGESTNESIFANYYDSSDDRLGENDYFTSPVINLTGIVSVDLEFSLAYAARSGYTHDRLSVIVSTDCGNTFPIENTIFQQWAYDMSTTSFSNTSYAPEGNGDWKTQSVNFSEFSNEENVVIAFIGTNGGGNNIYVDDITISTQDVLDNDIAITSVENVVVSSCINTFESSIYVKNQGFNTLNSFTIDYEINGNSFTENITGLELTLGKTEVVTITHSDLDYGQGEVYYEVRNPNGQTDENMSNNSNGATYLIDDSQEYSPFKITFSNDGEIENWNTLRTDSISSDWKFTVLDLNRVLMLEAYTNTTLDTKNYFISPSLQVESDEASLQFDLSYAYNFGKNDRLQILASTNCGISFDDILYDKSGTSLATAESNNAWIPSSDTDIETDWRRETVDLSAYGNATDLRLAFLFTNQNGNNIYIDNMEMYHTITLDTIDINENIRTYPNPTVGYINVKFNYFSKKDVALRLLTLSGKVVFEETIQNTLNQVYIINNLEGMEGVYILQALTSSGSDTKTVLITK